MSLAMQKIDKHPSWNPRGFKTESPVTARIKIQIPRKCHKEPVISRLTSKHGLTVNITGAMLGASSSGEGQFDLELHGFPQQIESAIAYLQELEVRIWGKPNPDGDGW